MESREKKMCSSCIEGLFLSISKAGINFQLGIYLTASSLVKVEIEQSIFFVVSHREETVETLCRASSSL
jgi:hypothetical protein